MIKKEDIVTEEQQAEYNEQLKQWDALYKYVKFQILKYEEKQNIPSNIILALKGLTCGKTIYKTDKNNMIEYSYDTILRTFQATRLDIERGIHGKTFKSELQKFLYICKIVENKINDVYLRMKKVKQCAVQAENVDLSCHYYSGAEYQTKSKDTKTNKRLEELW